MAEFGLFQSSGKGYSPNWTKFCDVSRDIDSTPGQTTPGTDESFGVCGIQAFRRFMNASRSRSITSCSFLTSAP